MVILMVAAPAVAGIAFGLNVQRGGDAGQFNPGVGGPDDVQISTEKPVVFQGEEDINFLGEDGTPIDAAQLTGVSGDAEGIPLEEPIPQDQERGQYTLTGSGDAAGVVVQTPRVTELEVMNERGVDVEGSTVQEDETLLVRAEWNFQQAEDLELVIRDSRGDEITGEVLADSGALSEQQVSALTGPYAQNTDLVTNPGQRGTGTGIVYLQGLGQLEDSNFNVSPTNATEGNATEGNATEAIVTSLDATYWALDVSGVDVSELSITVEGWDNLDFGPASQSSSLSVQTEDDVNLDLQDEAVTRGENVRYEVRGSTAGATHYVVIEDSEFRNEQVTADVFRDVQDVVDKGTFDTNNDSEADFAWAQIEIDEDTGIGVGQIDTSFLDDASVSIDLFQADRSLEDIAANLGNTEDDQTLDVDQGDLTFDNPPGIYVAGSDVDVSGTAALGVDDVVLYARDQGDWELLDINEDGTLDAGDTLSVDSTGEWDRDDVVLSEASDIFSIPGRYRIGVVEAQDVISNGEIQTTLSTSDFSSATSSQTSLVVQEPGLDEARTFQAINAQIATEDGTVDVIGTAPGLDSVIAVMIDSRGRVATERITVDEDDTFDEDDIPLTTMDGRELNEGEIRAFVIGLGRDGVAGDGVLPGQPDAELSSLENYVQGFGTGLTQEQVVARINDETTNEVASDDLSIEETFRYTDGATSIESVGPAGNVEQGEVQDVSVGDQMVVAGLTNRKPDDNSISVEVIDGPSANEFETNSTDEWGLDGRWTASLATDGVEPGTYTVEVDDGDNTDTVQVEILPADDGGNETPTDDNETTTEAEETTTEAEETTTELNETTTEANASAMATGETPARSGMSAFVVLGLAPAMLVFALVRRRQSR
ncbi:major cell surface glycoprotein [Halorubellus sp. JP-L1]|uniref:HVO_2072 family ArtA-dependent S-layer glycoprotein n=1 Tax=Halorubellus sp. JP-L1 TaxID=2715753 RepID=UPI001408EAC2|nr:HVO_2072 family ArtA-dependent S-layer glycoprotein [Halorubellus sp. JP-L1]NHN43040.1 major cell surface glycoprotein [Halorubellus sp. JP-L1]